MNVKMIQNALHLVLAMNANAQMMVILESIVKTVIFILISVEKKVKSNSLHKFLDDSCWNDPCEGCVPLGLNSKEFKCTCLSKPFDSSCQLGLF